MARGSEKPVQVKDDPAARIRAALTANPRAMTLQVARELNVPEADVVRAMPADRVRALDARRWEELIRAFEGLGKLHVICSNGAVTLEAFGEFGNFSTAGPFFNVQTSSLDMHIRFAELKDAFSVEKPGHMDGVKTMSFQFYDRAGNSAFKVFLSFGGSAPTPERVARFEELRERFGGN